ncbi:hypothetical protein [Tenacibaculum maritimum]
MKMLKEASGILWHKKSSKRRGLIFLLETNLRNKWRDTFVKNEFS